MKIRRSNDYLKLRLMLQHRGTSIRRWALDRNLPVGLVYNAARGERHGPMARKILNELEAYAK